MGRPQPGEIFDTYKIIKPLGEGGQGEVLLAEDIKLSRQVALKFLGTDKSKIDMILQRRFENEAKILASLNHPNIVKIYNLGIYSNLQFLVMEYVQGHTLSRIIEKRAMGVADAIDVIKQIARGLEEAHQNGILHRDIKPANLLVDQQNRVKIVDFGISKSVLSDDPRLTQADHFIGTINYTAPEILTGHQPSPASDIFSVGVVFYELLTGCNPFFSKNKFETIERIKNQQINLPKDITKVLSDDICRVLSLCLAKDKAERYQITMDFLNDLETIKVENLPDFHGVSIKPEIVILNKEKIRLGLLQAGFLDSEARIIINLAAKIEQDQPITNDDTAETNLQRTNTLDSGQIKISKEVLKSAIESFEESRTKAQSRASEVTIVKTSRNLQETTVTKTREAIPFPLFKPNFIKKTIVYIGLLFLSYAFYAKTVQTTNHQSPSKLAFIKSLFNEKSPEGIAPLNSLKKMMGLNRSFSSIPSAPLDSPPKESSLRYKVTKTNNETGQVLVDDEISLNIKESSASEFTVYQKSRANQKYSINQYSSNTTLPPLSMKPQGGTKTEMTFDGEYARIYPLTVGKTNDFTYRRVLENGTFIQTQRKCEVKKYLTLAVMKKNWQVFEIHCLTTQGSEVENTKIFYSPFLRRPVKTEIQVKTGDQTLIETQELVKFRISENQ